MRVYITLTIALLLATVAGAQDYGRLLYAKVARAQNAGAEFHSLNIFSAAGTGGDTAISSYRAYQPLQRNILQLYTARHKAVSITLQAATGKQYTLQLVQSHPTSADARIGYIDEGGKHATPYETGLHYNGIVKGADKSVAAMSVFSNGEVMILFSCGDGNFNMGKLDDGRGKYILYNSEDRLFETDARCMIADTGSVDNDSRAAAKGTGDIECKKLRIYWEVDYTFYQSKGSVSAVQNYLTGVFNFMQSIYYNDGMAIEMSSMYIWTIDDPISVTDAWQASWQFQRYWISQDHTYYGEQAHLIMDLNGWQGWAYVGAICHPNGYAISNLLGQQLASYPVYDVDVYVVSHETGHTVGAQHAHSCSWNTGPGGICGSVDNCTTQESGSGCGSCYYLNDAQAAGFKGTIMSYCGTKINFSEGFGSVIGTYLRGRMSAGSCFKPVISPEFVVDNICNNDGAITLNYKTDNFGVAPYTYTWSGGQQTKDITGLSAPGKYYVTITDSNNCTITDTAEVFHHPKPGDGDALPGTMPYCCKDTAFDVTLTAALPVNLTSCQTVAWLRTTQPITSYNDALTAYANAVSGDLLLSDNDTSVNNTTRAELTIASPANCNSTTTYYYTPYVARKPLQQSVYSTTGLGWNDVKNGAHKLGTTIYIVADPKLPGVCEGNWQQIGDTVTVNISNYTGRANKLTIRLVGTDGEQLHVKGDYPGDGTYKIPITNIDNHFEGMEVKAYDFNCSSATNCTPSSLSINAVREVTYHPLPALTPDSSCVVGQSVLLSFGPDSCNLGIATTVKELQQVSLYPNPAGAEATLAFYAGQGGSCTISLQDISGRTILQEDITYTKGRVEYTMNTRGIAAGVYVVKLRDAQGVNYNRKLTIN